MSNRRRVLIVIASVTLGSFIAAMLVKSRMGTLSTHSWQQIAINFVFALAIVIVIGILLRNKKDKM